MEYLYPPPADLRYSPAEVEFFRLAQEHPTMPASVAAGIIRRAGLSWARPE